MYVYVSFWWKNNVRKSQNYCIVYIWIWSLWLVPDHTHHKLLLDDSLALVPFRKLFKKWNSKLISRNFYFFKGIFLPKPAQLVCMGKSTVISRLLRLIEVTRPIDVWFTLPHLYWGVVTDGLTRTRSPTLKGNKIKKDLIQDHELNS